MEVGWALLAMISLQIVRLEEVSNRVKKPVVAGDSEGTSRLLRRIMRIRQVLDLNGSEEDCSGPSLKNKS